MALILEIKSLSNALIGNGVPIFILLSTAWAVLPLSAKFFMNSFHKIGTITGFMKNLAESGRTAQVVDNNIKIGTPLPINALLNALISRINANDEVQN